MLPAIPILLADDNRDIREMLDLILEHRNFRVVHCSGSWPEVLQFARTARFARAPRVAIVDLDMPGFTVDTIDELRAALPDAHIVVHTGWDQRHVEDEIGELPSRTVVVVKGSIQRLLAEVTRLIADQEQRETSGRQQQLAPDGVGAAHDKAIRDQ